MPSRFPGRLIAGRWERNCTSGRPGLSTFLFPGSETLQSGRTSRRPDGDAVDGRRDARRLYARPDGSPAGSSGFRPITGSGDRLSEKIFVRLSSSEPRRESRHQNAHGGEISPVVFFVAPE